MSSLSNGEKMLIKEREKAEKLATKEREKAEKLATKEREKAEKLAAKEREKAEKLATKEREKAEKLAAKEREKAEKLAAKEREKAEKLAAKEREKAEKLAIKQIYEKGKRDGMKQGKKLQKIAHKKQLEREESRFEIKKESILKLIQVAKKLKKLNKKRGYTISDIVETYIDIHGKINPYSLEPVLEDYDLDAAIRGIVYESSPSSLQHWFRYGERRSSAQISPWIFANKELAIINNKFDWRKTSSEMAKEKRNNIGKWYYIKEPNIQIDWNETKYGPLPTKEQLDNAEESGERLKGIR